MSLSQSLRLAGHKFTNRVRRHISSLPPKAEALPNSAKGMLIGYIGGSAYLLYDQVDTPKPLDLGRAGRLLTSATVAGAGVSVLSGQPLLAILPTTGLCYFEPFLTEHYNKLVESSGNWFGKTQTKETSTETTDAINATNATNATHATNNDASETTVKTEKTKSGWFF